jgi:glycosyltransferase involved in cell wall biosynthesis
MVPNTGGCPDLAQGAARLIDPLDIGSIAEGMLALDRSEDLRKHLREAGLNRAKMFSWDQTAQKTLDVFDAIISRNGHPETD